MMLSPIDKVYVDITVTARLRTGTPATLAGVDVAILPPRTDPDASTAWTASTYAAGVATVLLAGPSANPAGAIPVPLGGGNVWLRVTDTPEVQAVNAGHVYIV